MGSLIVLERTNTKEDKGSENFASSIGSSAIESEMTKIFSVVIC